MKTYYVNPYTDELCMLEASGADWHRAIEALEGQGVTQKGSWFPEDFMNWGIANIAKWSYSKVSRPCKSVGLAVDRKREEIEKYKRMKKGKL